MVVVQPKKGNNFNFVPANFVKDPIFMSFQDFHICCTFSSTNTNVSDDMSFLLTSQIVL